MPTSYGHRLDTLLDRFHFHFTKNQIKQVMETTARSREAFKSDVLAIISSSQSIQNKVDELGLLALQLNTRQVEVFSINEVRTLNALGTFFTRVQPTTETLIIDAFPFPIEDSLALRGLRPGNVYPLLSDTITMGNDLYNRVVVCTVVDKEIEEPVPNDHLSQTGLQQQSSDTTYMMKRNVRTQLFHVIYWCARLSRLILSVDRNVLSVTVAQEQLFVLRNFLMGNGVDPGNATNVFGAIEALYNLTDGYITKLGHVTTDGNPVRIPLKGQQKCLKEDHYHNAGEGGGYVHAKFAIAKKWEFLIEDTSRAIDVEIGLMGQPKMLDTAQPLTDFSINKVKRLEDFSFAIDKVLFHTPNPNPNPNPNP